MTYLGSRPLPDPFPTPCLEIRNTRRRLLKIVFLYFLPPRSRPRDIFERFSCRPSSAHVSGSLGGPFWEPFFLQKASFVDVCFSSRGGSCLSCFLIRSLLRVSSENPSSGAARKRRTWLLDPQNAVFFQCFTMFATPPGLQQGRQQRTKNNLDIKRQKTKK